MSADEYIRYSSQDGFSTSSRDCIITPKLGAFESCWHFTGDVATGKLRKLEIRSGFDLWIDDCFVDQNLILLSNDITPYFSFRFYLPGSSASTVGASKNPLDLKGGQQGLLYSFESSTSNRVESGTRFHYVAITLSIDRLFSYLEDDMHPLTRVLQKIIERKRGDCGYCYIKSITPDMQIALHQIMNCPYRGVARKLFIESRALELIAFQLNQVSGAEPSGTTPRMVHPNDRKNTEFAKSILLRNMENPPSLKALASAARMSHTKLNHCFRRIYGMTAFQYLREARLNRAREMLENQGLSVTEAAYAVGYDSLSHFSQAYKKHFGISPGIYLKAV